MTVAIFLSVLLGAILLGVPVAFALLICGVALMLHLDLFDAQILAQQIVSGADSFTGGRNISCAGISGFGNRFCVAVTPSGTGIPAQAILLRCRLPDYFRAVTVSLFFVDSERFFLSAGSAYPEPSALLCTGGRFCIIVPAVTMYAFIPACAFGTAGAAVPGPVSFRCAAAGAAVPRPVSFRCAAS